MLLTMTLMTVLLLTALTYLMMVLQQPCWYFSSPIFVVVP
jgi:hypothetical protein